MKLLVARHGQTQWNVENRICGRTDLHLTEEGRLQAQHLAEKAAGLQLDLIISSPMKRALETSEPIAQNLGLPVIVDERLIEQDYGIFEGLDRQNPEFLENKRQFAVRYPCGESMMDLASRVYSLIDDVKRKYTGKNVLLVCHGGVCRVIRTYFEDMTNEEYFSYSENNAEIREYML